MNTVNLKLLFVVLTILAVAFAQNATTPTPTAATATTPSTSTTTRRPSAIAKLGQSVADIPLGLFQACKDGAEAFEILFRGLFGR